MSRSIKIWMHVILATQNRRPLIRAEIKPLLYTHLRKQLQQIGCEACCINGMPDHVHVLFLSNPQKNISEIIRHIKSRTAYALNAEALSKDTFRWQRGYAAYSVSQSQLDSVYQYIAHQERHHECLSFHEEYEAFVALYHRQTA